MKKQLRKQQFKSLLLAALAFMPLATLAQDIEINATNFPDGNFRAYLLGQDYGKDGVITEEEIGRIWDIDVSRKNISSLKGIEYFTELGFLSCIDNQLTSLDLSKNTKLGKLDCSFNQLVSLNVSQSTSLATLHCHWNQLTSLNVSNNTILYNLVCDNNQLTFLDVSQNTALEIFQCDCNQLTSLDVSQNTALEILSCSANQLTSLNVSNNTALTYLLCGSNQLTSLDVSSNTALEVLLCNDNQLTSLNVSRNIKLEEIDCCRNMIAGEAMDAFIGSLPENTNSAKRSFIKNLSENTTGEQHSLCIYADDEEEGNVCTTDHVAIAKAKGWRVEDNSGAEYEGVAPTGITLPTIENIDENTPIYDLSGQRVSNLQGKKGVYIVGGKKVLVK